MTRRTHWVIDGSTLSLLSIVMLLAVVVGCSARAAPGGVRTAPPLLLPTRRPSSAPTAHASLPAGEVLVESVIGRSVQGRPLRSYRLGARGSARRVLVIGVVHGNEAAGLSIAEALRQARPVDSELVVVPDLNPDGAVLGTRQNADGVDLNRNFPWRWAAGGRPGDQQYPGRSPLSEPESRALARLVRQLRPTVTVWFHQPLGVIDESGGSLAVERRFARLSGEPLRRLTRYNGSAVSWQNALLPGSTAFVVELRRHVTADERGGMQAAVKDLAP